MNKSVMELTEDLGAALKKVAQPSRPMRLARGNVKEIGALWEADVEFLLDGDDIDEEGIDEEGIDVRKVTFDGVEVDYEVLSCAAQEEITWICMESMK